MDRQPISDYKFLQGGGSMGELIRSYDWSSSLLGKPCDWPNSLKIMVGVMLSSPFPMHITWGPKFIQLYNDGYQPVLGNEKHPLALGRPIYESYPEIWDTIGPMFYGVMDGTPVRFQDFKLYLDRNGTKEECYFDFSYSPIINEQGIIEGVLTNVIETTNRKHSELRTQKMADELAASNEELAASNEELRLTNEELAHANINLEVAHQKVEEGEIALRLAIEAASFGTWYIHSGTREFITDSRLKELFGYLPDEPLTIEQTLEQITEEYRGYVSEKLEAAIYNNGDYDVTYSVIGLHDNRLRWLRAIGNLKADATGDFSAFTGVVMDITDQVQSRISLESAYEQLRLSKEAAQLGFFDLDLNKKTMEWDSRCRELFGISHNEEVNYEKDFVNGLYVEDRKRILDIISDVFIKSISEGIYDVEYRTVGPQDQKLRWVRAKGQVYFDQNKNPIRFIGSVLDITEQKQDEQRKNDFIGMVSHELKTPLTSINGYIQILKNKVNKEEQLINNLLAKANKQTLKMIKMINGFLNVSRLESGKILIEYSHFDLALLFQEIEEEVLTSYPTHRLLFAPVQETWVNADKDKITQVIENLISNAVKYSPLESIIHIACVASDGTAMISVQDFGFGIDSEDLPKLFDRFYRVKTHAFNISGFGIGLYLCSEIINRHHGKLWVKSETGSGSTFYFTLPIAVENSN